MQGQQYHRKNDGGRGDGPLEKLSVPGLPVQQNRIALDFVPVPAIGDNGLDQTIGGGALAVRLQVVRLDVCHQLVIRVARCAILAEAVFSGDCQQFGNSQAIMCGVQERRVYRTSRAPRAGVRGRGLPAEAADGEAVISGAVLEKGGGGGGGVSVLQSALVNVDHTKRRGGGGLFHLHAAAAGGGGGGVFGGL